MNKWGRVIIFMNLLFNNKIWELPQRSRKIECYSICEWVDNYKYVFNLILEKIYASKHYS